MTRIFLPIFMFFVFVSGSAYSITFDEARHLLARTGFGIATSEEIEEILPLEYEAAVDHILDGVKTYTITPPPSFYASPLERQTVKDMSAATLKDYAQRRNTDRRALRYWWSKEMLETKSPFTERMVLFWHNHFVSTSSKVGFGQWLFEQNVSFRKHAVGNFRKLLYEISIGPAMLIYLDAGRNQRTKPNENFAREIFELFTLGEGQLYTENDIRESARAFTGWQVDYDTARPTFHIALHDNTEKTIMGETGNFDGFDVMEIILSNPRVAEYLVEKLWREFVSLKPEAHQIKELSKLIVDHHFELRPVMKALLMSQNFRDKNNRATLIKSPVELTIGTLRLLGGTPADYKKLWYQQIGLGQNIFEPPDVKGWRGGKAWISSTTTLRRIQFLRTVYSEAKHHSEYSGNDIQSMNSPTFRFSNFKPMLVREQSNPGHLQRLLLARAPVLSKKSTGASLETIRELLLDPAYQLK